MSERKVEALLAESAALTASINRREDEARALREERLSVWAQLRQASCTDRQIAESAGVTQKAVTMARRRSGETTVGTRNRGAK